MWILIAAIAGLANYSVAARAPAVSPHSAEEAVTQFTVADGLEVSLFAAEPMVRNPTDIDVDERGRVWVCEGVNYRSSFQRWGVLQPAGDRIVVLEDTDSDGKADKETVFYQDPSINAALGICVLGNRVIVSDSPNVFVLTDTDGDGKADKVTVFDQNPALRSPLGIAVLGNKVIISQSPDVIVYTKDDQDHIIKKEVLLTGWRGVDHDHGVHAVVFGHARYHLPLVPVLLIFTFLVPVIFYDQRYILDLGILVLTYVMLGWGLNVVVGLAGLLDLGYVAFYAVGAYSYALLATNFGLSFWVCLPLAGILAAFWGVLLGFPVLRLRGDYLAIVTLAFGEIIRLVIINWQSLTGGPNGVTGIPRPTLFGIPLTPGDDGLAAMLGIEFSPTHRIVFLFYLILALALLTNWVTIRLRRLPIGRAWEALREDEVACRALGINTTTTKLTAFATGAMFGGFAGAFFATRQGFISPESFTFHESALVLAIVVLGGMGSQLGVALAALAMIGGFELFRGLEQYRMLVFGMAMVLLMIWRPRGLIGHRAPTVFLKHSQAISSDLVKEGHG
jgi:branched-chain amino acid transport system permease protein